MREFREGERALLFDAKGRKYLVTLAEGGEFHTHAGVVPHALLIGAAEGVTVRSTAGARYTAITPRDDIPASQHIMGTLRFGASAATSVCDKNGRFWDVGHLFVRAGADVVGYETRADFAVRARRNVLTFLGDDAAARFRVEERDVYAGIDETELDRVVLDLPEPWRVVKHAEAALRPGGILVAYLPTVGQVAQLRDALDDSRFGMAETMEVLQRTWHVEGQSVRPDHRMVGHTGFLTHARLLGA